MAYVHDLNYQNSKGTQPNTTVNKCRKYKGFYPPFAPTINSLSVTSSSTPGIYSRVYINGTNFLPPSIGTTYVNFGGYTNLPITYYSSFSISFVVPLNATAGIYNVVVVNIYDGNFSPPVKYTHPGVQNYSNSLTYTIGIMLTATPITPSPVYYNGSLQTAAVLANPNGTYTGSLTASGTIPGTYTSSISGTGNYFGTVQGGNFVINYIPLTATPITPSPVTYNGSLQTAAVLDNPNGTYTGSLTASGTIPGTYTSSITGTGFYTGTVQGGNFVIVPPPFFVYTFNYTGSTPITQQIIIDNIPIINQNNSFVLMPTITNISSLITVTVYFVFTDNGSNDGLSFSSVNSFYNSNTNSLTFTRFDSIPLSRGGSQFFNLNSLKFTTSDNPSILSNTSLNSCFQDSITFDSDISGWNTTNVTSMVGTFYNAQVFNQNIGSWITTNVTNMTLMFFETGKFNQNIGGWDTHNVLDMAEMFGGAAVFNQNIGRWNVGKVIYMNLMFNFTAAFNNGGSGDIINWNTSSVIDMAQMFSNASAFNQDIHTWSITQVTSFNYFTNPSCPIYQTTKSPFYPLY
jgi:surface protein